MSESPFAKGSCQHCANHIEFPVAALGARVNCPHCGQLTELQRSPRVRRHPSERSGENLPLPAGAGRGEGETVVAYPTVFSVTPAPLSELPPPAPNDSLSISELLANVNGVVSPARVLVFYRLGLFLVTLLMLALPLIYLGLTIAAAWGVWHYATHFAFLLASTRFGVHVYLLKLVLYFSPIFAGVVLVFFMIKPLFARRAPRAQPLALNPAVEKTLFGLIARICTLVGAPLPNRIDLDCQLNASAGLRRGLLSLFSDDLVLTIGLPLVAGLNVGQLAGVLAHEFGHFTQGAGMRLSYIIRNINAWFARVVYERDAWDVMLEEWAIGAHDWRLSLIVSAARFAVFCSRQVLKLLMLTGHGVSCFLLRQMEYDADSYEIKLAGSATFESVLVRFHILGEALNRSYKSIRTSWNLNRRLPDDLPAYLVKQDQELPVETREQIENVLGLAKTGIFDTHPCDADRIRCARQMNEPGIFNSDLPAAALFSNFQILATQVTQLHYTDDLGLPLELAKLCPVEKAGVPAS